MSRAYLLTPPPDTAQRPWAPAAHPGAYQTWSTRWYWRDATCAEIGCEHYLNGWTSVFDETTNDGRLRADYFRYHAGRRYTEGRSPEGLTLFSFPAGQPCFRAHLHKIQAERPPLYIAQPGDWRGSAGKAQVYDRGDQFADDLHTHTDRIAQARSRAGTADP